VPSVTAGAAAPTRAAESRNEVFLGSALDGAPRWVSGVLAAVQAAVLSLLVLVLPAVASFVATAADPANSGVSWFRAVHVGVALWLAGHGVPLEVSGSSVTLVPLGVTALAVFACYASARRSGIPTRSGLAAAVGTYVVLVLVVALASGVGPGGVARAFVGGVLVGGVGLGCGLAARPGAPSVRVVTAPLWARVPPAVRVGAGGGAVAVGLLVAVASLVTSLWVIAGLATIRDVVDGLSLDPVGGTVLAFAELVFAPNLVVWCIAWLAGPGFAVGLGTHFAPHEVVAGPMPAVPLLGALPSNTLPGAWRYLTPLLLVGIGALAGWYVHRRLRPGRWWHPVVAVVSASAVAALLVGFLVLLASGGVGPGRMTHVGASALLVAVAVGWPVLLGALLAAVPSDPAVRAGVRARLGRAGARRGSTAD